MGERVLMSPKLPIAIVPLVAAVFGGQVRHGGLKHVSSAHSLGPIYIMLI